MLRDEFGQRLKQLREERGWTQEKLAEISGISDRHIRNIESAKVATSIDVIEKLAQAFGIHPREFFDWH